MTHFHQIILLLRFEFGLYTVRTAVWILTLGFAIFAGWKDFLTRRIPNWLTVSGFFAGLVANAILGKWFGALSSLEGALLALGILLPLVLLRGLGAGDWKLMGAIGALMGMLPTLLVLLASIFISGIIAVIQVLLTRRVKSTARNMVALVYGFWIFGLRANPEISLDNPTLMKLPFGTSVAMAVALIFTMSHWATNWQW